MKRKHLTITVVAVLLLLVIYRLADNKKELNKKSNPEPTKAFSIPVKVAIAEEQLVTLNILKAGNLTAFKEVKILTTASGLIQQIKFNLGDQVKAGQVLAVIDTRSNQIDLHKAESKVAKLKNDLQTYTELYEGKAATKEKLEEVRQNYNDAVSETNQIGRQIVDAFIKAPTDGVISTKMLEQGVFANAGAELGSIVNLSQAKVQVNLTESEVYLVRKDQHVRIKTDVYPDVIFDGRITFISPQADPTHNYIVEILIKNSDKFILRSGTFVYADFSRKTQESILVIPREALTESIKDASVYVVDQNNIAYLKPVSTGREVNGMIEVRSGLNRGDRVVTSGQINLKSGAQISISK